MGATMALRAAVELIHMPSRVRMARSEALPTGVDILLRIAAGEEEAEQAGIAATGRSREVIRRAAAFFIEQVLFCPNADSYRVLGADPQASTADLRRNMALLVRWLHPDMDRQGERSVFATRVTLAWNDLKTPERRAIYDEARRATLAPKRSKSHRKSGNGAGGKQVLAGQRHRRARWGPSRARVDEKQSLMSRAWLFLLNVARQ
jgi:hypothetical protein